MTIFSPQIIAPVVAPVVSGIPADSVLLEDAVFAVLLEDGTTYVALES